MLTERVLADTGNIGHTVPETREADGEIHLGAADVAREMLHILQRCDLVGDNQPHGLAIRQYFCHLLYLHLSLSNLKGFT